MSFPTDRKYSETHEWYLVEGDTVTLGITQYAADELTDITYVELPEVGTEVGPQESCGGIESVKAYSELYSVVQGKVIEVNEALNDNPAVVNEDAHGAWMVKIRTGHASALDKLMDAKAYEEHIAAGG
jgi:glycine cleavage system H protein